MAPAPRPDGDAAGRASPRSPRRALALAFVRDLLARYRASRVPLLAAALAYYAAFSLGPLLLLLGGWLALVLAARPDLAAQYRLALTDLVEQLMPLRPDAADLVTGSFELLLEQLSEGARLRSALSLVVLLWASSGFFASLQLALEVIFDVPETRGFLRKRLVALALVATVAAAIAAEMIGGLVLAAIARASDIAVGRLDALGLALPPLPDPSGPLGVEVLRFAVATAAFAVAFRYLPRRASSWGGALVGALFATTSILLTRRALLAFFDPERFNLIYGIVTSLLLVLLWLYLALLLFLIGALLVAEISAWRRAGGPPGAAGPTASPPGREGRRPGGEGPAGRGTMDG